MNPLKYCFALIVFPLVFMSCDFNEYPPQVNDQEFDIFEYSPTGTVVGFVEAHDDDEDQVITFEIVQASDEGIFDIDPLDGSIFLVDSEKLDYEQTKQVKLIVSVSDNHKRFGQEATAEVQINIVEFTWEVPESGLVAFYPFNGNANDLSGNQIHGEVHGAQTTSDRFGIPDQAYLFDGKDDVIWLQNANPFHFGSQDFSISAWIESGTMDPTVTVGSIFSVYHSSGDREFIFGAQPSEESVFMTIYHLGQVKRDRVNAERSTGWHLYTVTKSSSHLRMYKDGILMEEVAVTVSLEKGSAVAMIGAVNKSTNTPDSFFHGKIDDVAVYNRVLEESEIQYLYQGDK